MTSKMNHAPGPETLVAIAVVRRGEDFLVGQRSAEGPLPNLAEFPGGKCMPGESVETAAVRECLEETGLVVQALGILQKTLHTYAHGALCLVFVACEPTGPAEPRAPFLWVHRSALATLSFPEANRDLLKRLEAGLW